MTSAVTPPKTQYPRRRRPDAQSRRNAAFQATSATLQGTQQPQQTKTDSAHPPLVTLTGVNKVYDNGSQALRNINLQIKRGDFLFVTGPSGAGKSTLLKLLYGQERATSGKILVDDKDLAKLRGNRLAMLRRRIGIVFQDYKLIPRRTVAENVSFVLWAQGYSRREINRRLRPTLRMVGLQHKASCFPDQLSGGEQQRVSIARAVVSTPPLLLADEPTGNLDGDNSRQVIKILEKLNSIGITVIVTTHDEQLVRSSNHPVVQIKDGRLTYVRH
ncbi:cell division ATP-binding protein FtsE [Leptolyngbyaceae cyanobacterium CCMR0082]|uniref:Cell division ATP-binding protein FtsE n=1 Tax=Adonisia turfae CCMR0082 TaxID=2304604 RepID=A0A6M0S3M2_9CYAN|nr:cell division ATP-binding protein FtsE [Adonisia turfae]MDV3347757.1 cell division ATP-binding protein FtsE [Leptothoe sp. LEGE 181152]NEZ62633.1 cell division ATP-binding protein FtsE [Adonisia turfae CCMR0082]